MTEPVIYLRACPNVIIDPDHFTSPTHCKCDDPNEAIMLEWGYEWDESLGHWA